MKDKETIIQGKIIDEEELDKKEKKEFTKNLLTFSILFSFIIFFIYFLWEAIK